MNVALLQLHHTTKSVDVMTVRTTRYGVATSGCPVHGDYVCPWNGYLLSDDIPFAIKTDTPNHGDVHRSLLLPASACEFC